MLLPVALWVGDQALSHLSGDLGTASVRRDVSSWSSEGRQQPSAQAVAEALSALSAAVARHPQDPELREALADAQLVAVRINWDDEPQRMQALNQAIARYQEAAEVSPRDGGVWASLAFMQVSAGHTADAARSWRQALALAPNDAHVRTMLTQTALMRWQEVPEDMRDWVLNLFEAADAAGRRAINAMADAYGITFRSENPPRD